MSSKDSDTCPNGPIACTGSANTEPAGCSSPAPSHHSCPKCGFTYSPHSSVSCASIAFDHDHEESIRQFQMRQGINRILQQVLDATSDEELAATCLEVAVAVTDSKMGFISDLNAQGRLGVLARMPATNDLAIGDIEATNVFEVRGIYGRVILDGRPVLTNEPSSHPDSIGTPDGHPPITAFLGVPLLHGGRCMGLLAVANREGGYTEKHQERLVTLSHTVVAAIMRRRTEAALRESEERYRALAEELQAADRRKNEFLGVLSHEIRNPLSAIMMSLSLFVFSSLGRLGDAVGSVVMSRQIRLLSRIADDLRDIIRITQNRINLHTTRLDLAGIVTDTIEDYKLMFAEKGVSLSSELPANELFIEADAVRVSQIIGNLLHNAVKFTPSGGHVRVVVWAETALNRAVIQVVDDGIGMSPEVLSLIFEPFVQADTSLDRSSSGLGLGLALVRLLTELHGGEASAHSEGPGKGSVFTVRLPMTAGHQSAEQTVQAPAAEGYGQRILVIEDNKDVANIIYALLKMEGYEPMVAYNGAEGLDKAREFPPRVVICDIGLPGMNGYQIAEEFRSNPSLERTVLIALTGYAQPNDIRRARQAGFHTHLAKPVDLEKLKVVLSQALGSTG